MTKNTVTGVILMIALTFSACTPVIMFRLRNESGQYLEMYASGERRLSVRIGETSNKSVFFGGNWGLSAGECSYRYNFPEVYRLAKINQGLTSVFTLVVDKDFIVRLEYPPDWKGEKLEITGLPAVPKVMCE